MAILESVLAALGLGKGATIGGFLGALVSLKFIEGLRLWQGASTLFCGALTAAYVTPLVMSLASVSEKTEGAIGFLVGVFGMSIAAAIIKAVPEIISAAKEKWIK